MSKCACVYATAANTPAVRAKVELGGYLKVECASCKAKRAPDLLAALAAAPSRKPKRRQEEFQHQTALFAWARLPAVRKSLPGLELLEGSMNGIPLPKPVAQKAYAAGMLAGAHDVRLPVARGRWIGLSIELKVGDNRPSADQLRIGELLEAEGWRVHFIWEWTEARALIIEYLNLPKPRILPA